MNVYLLLQALQNLIEKEAPMLPLPTKIRNTEEKRRKPYKTDVLRAGEDDPSSVLNPLSSVCRHPYVFIGSLPLGTATMDELVPFVLIQALEGYEQDGMHTVRVAFRVAVRDDEQESAENHLHNLMSLVRQAVMRAHEGDILEGKYQMRPDEAGHIWNWKRPDEQFPPFAEAYALANWAMKGIE